MHRAIVYLRFIYKPLTNRIQLGEGGIALFNVTHTWLATGDIIRTVFSAILSAITLCALYGYNDYKDRDVDLINPKKDHPFVQSIILESKLFLLLNLLLSFSLIVLCGLYMDATHAAFMMVLLGINFVYSNKLKAIVGLDLFIVMAWGGVFTLLSDVISFKLAILAGIMTGIAHFFQMLLDLDSDKESKISTTLVRHWDKAALVIIILSAILGAVLLLFSKNPLIAISAVLPVIFYFISSRVMVSWFLSRVYFFSIWMWMLNMIYGGI